MRPSTSAILATAAAMASMVFLAGCGGDGPEGAPPPPATTKAAPARSAASSDSVDETWREREIREFCDTLRPDQRTQYFFYCDPTGNGSMYIERD